MTRPVLLNNVDHKDLRVITRRGAEFGDQVMCALTFPAEFASIQAHYPIVFSKLADGSGFQPLALFGFREGQNLFLQGEHWDATYLPLTVERQPFLIGASGDELNVHVDLDSPRLSHSEGQPVFLLHGGTSEYLERVSGMLLAVHHGIQQTSAFIDALLAHALLESFVLDVSLAEGAQSRLAGFYTINEEKLAALAGDALGSLSRAGHLRAIYMAVASLANFRILIERLTKAHARQA